ncbi:unnamed protein product [Closterium sp. NIES-65]|nr:unnamed protein product [Closterium sp. NIES-65]
MLTSSRRSLPSNPLLPCRLEESRAEVNIVAQESISRTAGNTGGNHGGYRHSASTGQIHRVTPGLDGLYDKTGRKRFAHEAAASLKSESRTNDKFRGATVDEEEAGRTIGLTDAETGGGSTKLETSLKRDALKREAEEAVLAIDVGTGGTKAAVVTWHGAVVASAFWPHAPPRGADDDVAQARQTAEQEPSDWWRAAAGAAGECLAQLDGRKGGSSTKGWRGNLDGRKGSMDGRKKGSSAGGEGERGGVSGERLSAVRVVGVAVTGQMQDVILLPQVPPSPIITFPRYHHLPQDWSPNSCTAVSPAILYSDARATVEARERAGEAPLAAAALTGFLLKPQTSTLLPTLLPTRPPPSPTLVLAKLLWLQRHRPQTLKESSSLLLGACVKLGISYAADLLHSLGLSQWLPLLPEILPPTRPCGQFAAHLTRPCDPASADVASTGTLSVEAAELMGARHLAGIPVFHSCGDLGASAVGCGSGVPGTEYIYLGTSGWVAGSFSLQPLFQPSNQSPKKSPLASVVQPPSWSQGVFTLAHPDPSLVFRTAPIMTAGGNLKWAISNLLSGGSSGSTGKSLFAVIITCHSPNHLQRPLQPDVSDSTFLNADVAAASVPAGSGGLLYLPFLNGERCPFEDPNMRAAFIGISASTTHSHMIRAVCPEHAPWYGSRGSGKCTAISQHRQPNVQDFFPLPLLIPAFPTNSFPSITHPRRSKREWHMHCSPPTPPCTHTVVGAEATIPLLCALLVVALGMSMQCCHRSFF